MRTILFLISFLAYNTLLMSQVRISEIRIDQSGPDDDEYFELEGPSGTNLSGLHYIVIGDGTGGSGSIEVVVDLVGQAIPASGFFVCAESTFTIGTADFTTVLNFENSDNVTHLLVSGFTGANGDDLDTDNDCMLDVMPYTMVIDAIGLIESPNPPVNTECEYATDLGFPTIGPDGSFVPAHSFIDNNTGEWMIGEFNEQAGTDTPGSRNTPFVSIELLSFTAHVTAQAQVLLEWQTVSEEDNDYMTIEHSKDGKTFVRLGNVKGAGTSLSPKSYTFIDQTPSKGINYYRLKQVDFDGTSTYHEIVSVSLDKESNISIFPTVAPDEVYITFDGLAHIQIINSNGTVIVEKIAEDGLNLSIIDLQAGHYFALVKQQNSVTTEVVRFIKN